VERNPASVKAKLFCGLYNFLKKSFKAVEIRKRSDLIIEKIFGLLVCFF